MPHTDHPSHVKIQVYWRPGCPFCTRLRRGLRRTGLQYEAIDIWQDATAAAYVRSVNRGDETVPTVAVAGHALTNPSVRQVLDLVRHHAPQLLPAPDAQPARRRLWPWRRTA
ncbi:mycoredoxin [Streptomyces alboflavus]|uniref:mycoredoxin n=1 Tax=Streptomyces alboflavus TaxID=67267 RepID=UPI0004C0A615|nr:mycoredoxin [Streptomyces alboflavus]